MRDRYAGLMSKHREMIFGHHNRFLTPMLMSKNAEDHYDLRRLECTCPGGGDGRKAGYPSWVPSRRRCCHRYPARPRRPEPNKSMVVGSGTVAGVAIPTIGLKSKITVDELVLILTNSGVVDNGVSHMMPKLRNCPPFRPLSMKKNETSFVPGAAGVLGLPNMTLVGL